MRNQERPSKRQPPRQRLLTSTVGIPRPPRNQEFRRDGRTVTIPTQWSSGRTIPAPPTDNIEWDTIFKKSRTLFDVPLIHNRTLRQILRYAKRFHTDMPTVDRFSATSVVYVIFHTRTSSFYVGESERDGFIRLREHWYDRTKAESTNVSSLTRFIRQQMPSRPDVWADFRVIPIRVNVEPQTRRQAETEAIAALRKGRFKSRCLNYETRNQTRRPRHRPPPTGEPSNRPPQATTKQRSLHDTLQHVLQLDATHQEDALSRMTCTKVRQLLKMVDRQSSLADVMRQTIAHLQHKAKKPTTRVPLHVSWTSKKCANFVNIKKVLIDNLPNWPLQPRTIENVQICYRTNQPVGHSIRNITSESLAHDFSSQLQCSCDTVDEKFKKNGHVLTTSTEVLLPFVDEEHRTQVRHLIEQEGSKFRFSLDDIQTLKNLRSDLWTFINAHAGDSETITKEQKKRWVDGVYHSISCRYYDRSPQSCIGSIDLTKILSRVHERFVLGPADKAPQNTVIWCKRGYHDTMDQHLNSDTFATPGWNFHEVFDQHNTIAKRFGFKCHKVFPYVYLLAKAHRLQPGSTGSITRPIVGKSCNNRPDTSKPLEKRGVNSLTDMNRHAGHMLNNIIDLLIKLDETSTVKRCWIIRSDQEFIDTVSTLNLDTMTVRDINDLYTKIDLEDLEKEVHAAIDLIRPVLQRLFRCEPNEVNQLVFRSDGKWCIATAQERNNRRNWSLDTLKLAVTELIQNSHIYVGGKMLRQQIGVGMGHESSGPLANIYLHMKERVWVNKQVAYLGPELIESFYDNFRGFARYLDDMFFTVSEDEHQLPVARDYGGLTFRTSETGRNVDFIGLHVCARTGFGDRPNVEVRVADKQKKYNFNIIRYPSWHSCIPRSIIDGTIQGILCRAFMLTSTVDHFVEEATTSLLFAQRRGYPDSIVARQIRKFVGKRILPDRRQLVLSALLRHLSTDEDAPRCPTPPAAAYETPQQPVDIAVAVDAAPRILEPPPRAQSTQTIDNDGAHSALQTFDQPAASGLRNSTVTAKPIRRRLNLRERQARDAQEKRRDDIQTRRFTAMLAGTVSTAIHTAVHDVANVLTRQSQRTRNTTQPPQAATPPATEQPSPTPAPPPPTVIIREVPTTSPVDSHDEALRVHSAMISQALESNSNIVMSAINAINTTNTALAQAPALPPQPTIVNNYVTMPEQPPNDNGNNQITAGLLGTVQEQSVVIHSFADRVLTAFEQHSALMTAQYNAMDRLHDAYRVSSDVSQQLQLQSSQTLLAITDRVSAVTSDITRAHVQAISAVTSANADTFTRVAAKHESTFDLLSTRAPSVTIHNVIPSPPRRPISHPRPTEPLRITDRTRSNRHTASPTIQDSCPRSEKLDTPKRKRHTSEGKNHSESDTSSRESSPDPREPSKPAQ